MVALGQRALDLDRALRGFQGALEFHQKSVADRFDLSAVKARPNRTKNSAMLLEQLERDRFVALRQGAVVRHVRKHDGSKPALFRRTVHAAETEEHSRPRLSIL